MRFFVLFCFIGTIYGFLHETPGESCTTSLNNLPQDANEDNTYDYIFVGLGATSTVTASKLAKDLGCSAKILAIEAGRSYTKSPECAPNSIDCFVQQTENDYHLYPSAFPYQSTNTRGTWAFETRSQEYSDMVSYSDGRTTDCPFDIPGFIPQGCHCITDKYEVFSHPCSTYTACIAGNPGNPTLCGTNPCPPEVCAKNKTQLYWRAASKGGSNSHHAMVTYHIPTFVANQWITTTGDQRFAFDKWRAAFKSMNDEWLNLTFTSNHLTPIGTHTNDTLKYAILKAGAAYGLYDLSTPGPDAILNAADFFDNPEKFEKYQSGFVVDQLPARQINSYTHTRAFPGTYLDQVMAECPSTLVVLCNVLATKILFADQGSGVLSRHAIGVEYVDGMDSYGLSFNYNKTTTDAAPRLKAYARKGIILGGGTFNSPQLLMLSGIGDETHLAQFDIPVRKHLPAVGNNLQDDNENTVHFHVTATGDPKAVNSSLDAAFGTRPYYVPDVIKSLFGHDASRFDPTTGAPINFPVAFNSFCHAGAVAYGGRACPNIPNSNYTLPDDPSYLSSLTGDGRSFYHDGVVVGHANVLTFFSSEEEKTQRGNPTCMALCGAGIYIKGWYDVFFHYGGAGGSIMACDVLTSALASRGTVRLRSSNPSDPPILDTNAFSAEEDLVHTGNCVNELRKILAGVNELSDANPSEYGGIQLNEYTPAFSAPGPSVSKTEVTPALEEWLKKSLWHHHPSSSNRMGNINDANSVVDSRGRVWGTSNLYVIDVSSMAVHPDIFPSNNAMILGYLQAEALVAHHTEANSRVCNVGAYNGARNSNQLDVTENPLRGATIALGVLLGVSVLGTLIMAIVWGTSRAGTSGGYQVINERLNTRIYSRAQKGQ